MISVTLSGLGCRGVILEHPRAFEPGLAARNAQVDQLAARRKGRGCALAAENASHLKPASRPALRDRRSRPRARRRGSRSPASSAEQRLVAVHDVERGEAAREMRGQMLRADLHLRNRPARASGRLARGLRRRTICCTASVCISRQQPLLLRFPGEHLGIVVGVAAAHHHFGRSAASRCRRRRERGTARA